MKTILTAAMMCVSLSLSFCQSSAIIEPIKALFDGMRSQDTAQIKAAFAEGAILETYVETPEGVKVQRTPAKAFVEMAGQPHSDVWNEVIWGYEVRHDGPLATVWTEYTFYLGQQLSHCGVNAFQLIEQSGQWKITKITDTRRKVNCMEIVEEKIDEDSLQRQIDEQVYQPFIASYGTYDAQAMNALHGINVLRANAYHIRSGADYKQHNVDQYAKGKARGDRRSIEFRFDFRKTTPTRAVDTGVYKITVEREGENKVYFGYFHVILHKVAGTWKITYDFDTDQVNGITVDESWWNKLKK